MNERPYVLLSCAASIDGYIDDTTKTRLLLSNDADFDRVDEVRAASDAILVGATTIRKDNPRLLVRSQARRNARTARGTTATPTKVTITGRGDLDPAARFFTEGDTTKIVYVGSSALAKTRKALEAVATVTDAGEPIDLTRVLADLASRNIDRLMVEGGGTVHTLFLTKGLVDELHLVIAPFFVGESRAPRFVADGSFPWNPQHPARLAEVTKIDNVVLLRYAMSDRYPGPVNIQTDVDRRWLAKAIDLSRKCPPTDTAYNVGAIIVAANGSQLAQGYSRETDPHVHAEESALAKLARPGPTLDLNDATIYSSLEPCSIRRSRPRACAELIIAAGIRRVVYALREPPLFAEAHGVEQLRAAGVEVIEIGDMGQLVRDVNIRVLTRGVSDG